MPLLQTKAIQEYFEYYSNIPIYNYDFCENDSSYCGKAYYNTKYGYALFAIPTPKGSELRYNGMSSDNTTIEYICEVDTFSNDIYLQPKLISGLSQEKGNPLNLSVEYIYKSRNCGNSDIRSGGVKKNTTPIAGHPIITPESNKGN
ncbi:hypothetical protein GCM10011368_08960 [Hyunsoonleella pacifica]|nr:hypothetical protein GCM10011368_08960 [Hyunsoonleella pacifica]